GPAAAAAANRALTLVGPGVGTPLAAVLQRCHAGLFETRGVALSLADLDAGAGTVTWLGVGNVSCVLARPAGPRALLVRTLLPARGVLGRRLPPLHPRTVPVLSGDVLILATDGIASHFQHELPALEPLQSAADDILQRYAGADDDALVVTLRIPGRRA